MQPEVADLLSLLELEQLEVNLFRGESRDVGSPQVFGGQVLGQALTAASATVSGRVVNSLHAYFLRRGDFNAPIVYQVDRSLDGHSFANRRVVAIQHGQPIFNMAASFQAPEPGLDHQAPMPQVPFPEELGEPDSDPDLIKHMPERLQQFFSQPRPFTFRVAGEPVQDGRVRPGRRIWFKVVCTLPDDEALHRCLLAYASDFFLLGTSLLPHDAQSLQGRLVMASIDHAMWFHRSLRVDDWLLYDMESPSASGARGFARAAIFSRDGRLVATTAQEGLVRVKQT